MIAYEVKNIVNNKCYIGLTGGKLKAKQYQHHSNARKRI